MIKIIKKVLLSHFYVDIIFFIVSACFLLIQWDTLTVEHRLAYSLFLGMCFPSIRGISFPRRLYLGL